jgi:alpha-L-rhamnosidase
MEFALGVNRPVIHTSVHQPLSDHFPGFSLWIFGQYFSRLETWGEMAKPWIDYISRNSYMLQQGRNVADVAYFYGEESPITALYEKGVPTDLPTRNGFDYVNADVLINQLSNDVGDVVAKSGARYKVIYLGGTSSKMTLALLKRLDALVKGGATLVGEKPTASPSLSDDPAEFARVADALWGGGKVLVGRDINAALATLKVAPDFGYADAAPDAKLMFVHRKNADIDAYYFTNRKDRVETTTFSFNITGKTPELWDAVTGSSKKVSFQIANGQTLIPLQLSPYQSGYIVFKKEPPFRSVEEILNVVSVPPTIVRTQLSGQLVTTELSGPWSLTFHTGRGAPASVKLPTLTDWSKSDIPGIKYFSGTGTYTKTITVAASALRNGKPLMLDLGEVREVAEVYVNGQLAGTAWKAPYSVDISGVAKPGKNALEIRVANLWVNRLIGDAQPGTKPITFTTLKTYTRMLRCGPLA